MACGGEVATDTTSTIATTDADPLSLVAYDELIHPAAMETAREIVDRLGPNDAFAAVVLALDAGYGADQIAEHVAAIARDGTIPGVAPSGPSGGVFAQARGEPLVLAAPEGLPLAAELTPADFLDVLNSKADRGQVLTGPPAALEMNKRETVEAFIGAIVALTEIGYSLEQIVEGLVFGEQRLATFTWTEDRILGKRDVFDDCIVLAERDGTLIAPSSAPVSDYPGSEACADALRYGGGDMRVLIDGELVAGVVTTTTTSGVTTSSTVATTTTEAAMTFPHTFAGSGTLTFSTDYAAGACVVDPVLMRVTLLPDGTVEGTVEYTNFVFTWERLEGVQTLVCSDGSPVTIDLGGTHEDGHVALRSAGQPDTEWLQGDYRPDALTIEQQNVSQVSADVTITYFSDWVFVLPHAVP